MLHARCARNERDIADSEASTPSRGARVITAPKKGRLARHPLEPFEVDGAAAELRRNKSLLEQNAGAEGKGCFGHGTDAR